MHKVSIMFLFNFLPITREGQTGTFFGKESSFIKLSFLLDFMEHWLAFKQLASLIGYRMESFALIIWLCYYICNLSLKYFFLYFWKLKVLSRKAILEGRRRNVNITFLPSVIWAHVSGTLTLPTPTRVPTLYFSHFQAHFYDFHIFQPAVILVVFKLS